MRTDLFDFELPADRIALRPAQPARCGAAARGAAGRDTGMRGPQCARSARAAAPGRPARRQRHQGDRSAASRPAHRPRARSRDRGDAHQAARRRALAGARQAGPQARGRRRRALRRRGRRVLSRGAGRHCRGKGRGRRSHVRLRLSRTDARCRDRGARRGAAAALYRGAPPDRRAGPRRLPDDVRPRGRRSGGADRRAALHAGPPREARRTGRRRCTRSPCMSAPARFSP